VIYGAYGLFAPPAEEDMDATVVVDANRISSFAAQWQARLCSFWSWHYYWPGCTASTITYAPHRPTSTLEI
jgi:hypothetical protein